MSRESIIEQVRVLQALINISAASKILSTFITAFEENSLLKDDGQFYLQGSFNLTGTQSMRLSSSNP